MIRSHFIENPLVICQLRPDNFKLRKVGTIGDGRIAGRVQRCRVGESGSSAGTGVLQYITQKEVCHECYCQG
jgi:hypothetical protein